MVLFKSTPTPLLVIATLAAFSHCKTSEYIPSTELLVVGGSQAQAKQFPAAIYIPGCSATVVSANEILTAAHCVVQENGELENIFLADADLVVRHGVLLKNSEVKTLKVVATFVHPSYVKAAVAGNPGQKADVIDVALIRVKDFQGLEITPARIEYANPGIGKSVFFTGYGCEIVPEKALQSSGGEIVVEANPDENQMNGDGPEKKIPTLSETEEQARFKFKEVEIISLEQNVALLRNHIIDENAAILNPPQNEEEEKKEKQSVFSGCPGDSGSAAYLTIVSESGKPSAVGDVVGVNSYINNIHSAFARLDEHNGSDIADCLQRRLNTDHANTALTPFQPIIQDQKNGAFDLCAK